MTKSHTERGVVMCNININKKNNYILMTVIKVIGFSFFKVTLLCPKGLNVYCKVSLCSSMIESCRAGHSNHHSLSSVWCVNIISIVSQLCNSFKIHHKDHYSHWYRLSIYIYMYMHIYTYISKPLCTKRQNSFPFSQCEELRLQIQTQINHTRVAQILTASSGS